MTSKRKTDQEDDDLFYFESDHLALKGNKDYSEVLKTIFILEAQRYQAIKDYDTVVELHKQALEDPELFLQKLKKGESIGVPDLQEIVELPNIQWDKYKENLPDEGLKFIKTRNTQKEKVVEKPPIIPTARSETFNKPWSTEEQKRLEELLIIYPPEPIELRRYKKIAAALGNRTVKQVSSRVQKYFLKLYKLGLPIPGRIPKYADRCKKSKLHPHQRHNHYLFKPTTFLPHLDVPVVMNEAEEAPGPSLNNQETFASGNYLIPSSTVEEKKFDPNSEVEKQLSILRRVKFEKQNALNENFKHFTYRCDYCNEEPITGTRWHCATCETNSYDFCNDCMVAQMLSENAHPLNHTFELISYESTQNENESSNDSPFESVKNESSEEENSYDDINEDQDESFDSFNQNEDDFEKLKSEDEEYEQEGIEGVKEYYSDDDFTTEENHKVEISPSFSPFDNQDRMFTDTQNISYNYLHSHLLLDNDFEKSD